jgi:hypothetical protein
MREQPYVGEASKLVRRDAHQVRAVALHSGPTARLTPEEMEFLAGAKDVASCELRHARADALA